MGRGRVPSHRAICKIFGEGSDGSTLVQVGLRGWVCGGESPGAARGWGPGQGARMLVLEEDEASWTDVTAAHSRKKRSHRVVVSRSGPVLAGVCEVNKAGTLWMLATKNVGRGPHERWKARR